MNRLFSIILIVVGLVVVLLPDDLSIIKPPTPMDPLAQEVKTVIGDRDKEGILQLSASVKAAALLFQGDRSRKLLIILTPVRLSGLRVVLMS